MFRPQFGFALSLLAAASALGLAPRALAHPAATPADAGPATAFSGTLTDRTGPAAPAMDSNEDATAILSALSGQAGIPFIPKQQAAPATDEAADPMEPRLCLRAGLGLSVPMMSGAQMTLQHGLIGCPTRSGGLPIIVSADPALQPPPTSRTGDYNLDLTLRYRLLQIKHMQLVASATEQGVGYSLSSPVSGNNLLLAMSLIF